MRSRTATSSAPSTASESKHPGTSASSTARATFEIRAARSPTSLRATKTRSSRRCSISTRSARSATPGSSSAIDAPIVTSASSRRRKRGAGFRARPFSSCPGYTFARRGEDARRSTVYNRIVMRDHVLLFINGAAHRIRGSAVFTTLSNYLRYELGKPGTKVVCEEGDCGACTVLVGRAHGAELVYEPVNSCIQAMGQLDLTSV